MLKNFILSLFVLFSLVSNSYAGPGELANKEEIDNGKALTKAIRNFKFHGNTVCLSAGGEFDPQIADVAVEFAREMATNYISSELFGQPTSHNLGEQIISHDGSDLRFASYAGLHKEEIIATTTAWTLEEAVENIVQGWWDSDGHRDSMMNFHERYAYALVKTGEPLPQMGGYQWFAVGLFADDE